MDNCVNKVALAERFGKAATTYDHYALLQQEVGRTLLSLFPQTSVNRGLDLGCGSGFFLPDLRELCNDITGLDLSMGMLHHAATRMADAHFVCGDAEALPLQDHSVDLVFSSLALQWCHDLTVAMREIKRVLTPQGYLLFATLSKGSLHELREAWATVDEFQHVNVFKDADTVRAEAESSGLVCETWLMQRHVLHYPDVRSILYSLKGIGAGQLTGARAGGLATRQKLHAMELAYQAAHRTSAGLLPVTYHVCYGVLHQ